MIPINAPKNITVASQKRRLSFAEWLPIAIASNPLRIMATVSATIDGNTRVLFSKSVIHGTATKGRSEATHCCAPHGFIVAISLHPPRNSTK
jgi:hypothetical protein